jgi:hypothetical protein
MATRIENDSSNLIAVGNQGSLSIAGSAVSWSGSEEGQFFQIQVKAADGAYISFDGAEDATSSDFQVENLFSDLYSRAQFAKMSFLDVNADGSVIYQGFNA